MASKEQKAAEKYAMTLPYRRTPVGVPLIQCAFLAGVAWQKKQDKRVTKK